MSKKLELKSYFDESLFVDGLLRPLALNIAPKKDSQMDLTTGYKYHNRNFGVNSFNSCEEIDFFGGTKMKFFVGSFTVYEQKDYDYYWDNENKKQTSCDMMTFTMEDKGTFSTKVEMVTDNEVEVTTKVNVNRNVVGSNFDGKSIRDGLFKDFPHENFQGSMEIKEYYKVIANGTRVLHYSDDSDFFEVYNLTAGWTIEDGIDQLVSPGWVIEEGIDKLISPKVFDDTSYDKQDKDLEEIMSIINSKQTNQAKHLVKKNDSTN